MIEAVRIVNIQSYADVTFRFANGINVFEAPNETGKSIIFKIFRTMCDANWYGRGERKSIIRRGCDKGIAVIVLTAGYSIQFNIYKTYQTYSLFYDRERIEDWKQDYIPERLLDMLGWYYDKNSKILLNLCDQELDMPFVNSNGRFNYEVMKFVLQDKRLENAMKNLMEWINSNKERTNTLYIKESTLEGAMKQYEYVDTRELELSIRKREDVVKKSTVLCDLTESLSNIESLEKPKEVKTFSDIDHRIEVANKLRQLGMSLQSIVTEKKPQIVTVDIDVIERNISVAKTLSKLRYVLMSLANDISESANIKSRLTNAIELKEDFELENSVCPLCGSTFNNKHVCE